MNCPKCDHDSVFVLQSNTMKPNHTTRQRECKDCKHKWFTIELEVASWAVGWEKLKSGFGGKPTLRVPVLLFYGDEDE